MHAVLVPFLVATVACATPARAEPRVDRPRYEVNVRVTRPFRVVTGDLKVTFTPNRPVDRLVFRLWPNGPRQLRAGSRLDVSATLPTSRPDPTTLVLRLRHRLAAGETIRVRLRWKLRMPATHSDRIARFSGGLRLGTFLPLLAWDPRRGWLLDPPARILGESAATPTADFDVHLRAPRGLTVLISEGERVRDVAVAVGRFRVLSARVGGVTVLVVAPPSFADADEALAYATHALADLSRRYGPYPWRRYTIVIPPDLAPSGIEYPTLSFVGWTNSYARTVVDHETAHQWFYSLVGNDQARNPWLDETLATWAQQRVDGLIRPARALPSGARRHVGEPMTYWTRYPSAYFFGVYDEGANALRSLGDGDAVDCALRRYAARRAYTIAQPGDLLDELNRVIPGADRRLRAWGIRR